MVFIIRDEYFYLPRQSYRKGNFAAMGTERSGGDGRGASALCYDISGSSLLDNPVFGALAYVKTSKLLAAAEKCHGFAATFR